MADQTITVTIPSGQTVVAGLGIILTHEGRIVVGNGTSPLLSTIDPKTQLLMVEQARNEISKLFTGTPLRSANNMVRS